MTNSDYILFLDESAETKANPYLLLGGIIISRNNYKKFLIPSIQNTKSILGNPNIVFHYTDILKKQKDFKIMCSDAEMRTKFWDSLRNSIASVDFKIIASFTNVKEYSKEYPKLSHDVYELLFSCVMNNYLHFLTKNNARGKFQRKPIPPQLAVIVLNFSFEPEVTNIHSLPIASKKFSVRSFIASSCIIYCFCVHVGKVIKL